MCVSTFIAGESVLTSQRTAPGSVQQSPKDSVVTGLSSFFFFFRSWGLNLYC
ncbi:rCG24907 [Rattus norvegicus]|uniref:RCG24907 n=1 Tax=Rattus norvegicus TaxID=10116 RepID=A6JCA8_RAT|nr:rCG24907 [Rattus norvegicus]